MKQLVSTAVFCLLAIPFAGTLADEAAPEIPLEADVTPADQALVEALGPSRGAIGVVADIREIKGLVAGVRSTVVDLNKAISDLGGKIEGNKLYIQLSADVLFDFDKATIKPAAANALSKVALIIKKKAKGPVTIIGHTDSKGTEAYNQELSLRRAESTKAWLLDKGGAQAAYQVEGKGESQPVADNTKPDGTDNPEGRAKNRRVDIIVQVEESH